jgi:protein SCO1/2
MKSAMLMVVLASCGSGSASLIGLQREDPLDVSAATITEAARDGSTSPFQFKAKSGELLVVFFGYTYCPDVCPTSLAEMRNALKRLGTDGDKVSVAFVTVDPERDTPERLHDFVGTYIPRYHVLRTTDWAILERVKEAFLATSSVTTNEDGDVEVTHTGTSYVVNEKGIVVDEMPFGIGADGMTNDLRILVP